MEFFQSIWVTLSHQSLLETIAVICAILYLVLIVRENIWCWFFAFVSTAIYIYLFHTVALFSESVLNAYYLFMAVYGWWKWSQAQKDNETKIHSRPLKFHLLIFLAIAVLTPGWGYFMSTLGASYPYLDAFVAVSSVIATVLVAYKVLENWYYWLVIDSISIYLFWQKGMNLTVLLFCIYIVLIFVGLRNWKQLMQKQDACS